MYKSSLLLLSEQEISAKLQDNLMRAGFWVLPENTLKTGLERLAKQQFDTVIVGAEFFDEDAVADEVRKSLHDRSDMRRIVLARKQEETEDLAFWKLLRVDSIVQPSAGGILPSWTIEYINRGLMSDHERSLRGKILVHGIHSMPGREAITPRRAKEF